MKDRTALPLTSFHWGTYRAEARDGELVALHPFEEDPDPSPIADGYLGVLKDPLRIKAPMVRKGWMEGGAGAAGEKRGKDSYLEIGWDEAERLVAAELDRVRKVYGNEAIFAGSYGWASAGRFHHAQGHLKRFMNLLGGFTSAVNTYSLAAGEVILPHILGSTAFIYGSTSWQSIIDHADLLVAFGGLPLKNAVIGQGGVGCHRARSAMTQARAAGLEFVNISPLRSDVAEDLGADWIAPRPSSDAALMIALAQVLLSDALLDRAFLQTYTVGFERFAAYLTGETDGVRRTPEWAAPLCEIPAETIRALAHRMAQGRTMISVSWSLTRQDHGEQPFWLGTVLAAMLGQIGLPGGGIGFGYGAVNTVGLERAMPRFQAIPQGRNRVNSFIPVSRIAELLENPGGVFAFDGKTRRYPDTRLVYWVGGNPFHHHQDLNRLRRAWARPETVIVHEWCWNALTKHADIVLPCTVPLERQDLTLSPRDPYLVRMDKVVEPPGAARDDYEIFRNIARHLGLEADFSEGRDSEDWLQWLYDKSRQSAARAAVELPPFDELLAKGWHKIEPPAEPYVMLAEFRADPEAHPLRTPSGKIEIFSETMAGFALPDCPGHPTWMEPAEWLGKADAATPLHLISNQPKNKLHSQLDQGALSRGQRVAGRQPLLLNPADAAKRGIAEGDLVRVFNARGACLCGALLSKDLRPGVVLISTGAWYDPDASGLCRSGNPNVLTLDKGTSQLAQGPTAHSCLVEVALFEGEPPEPAAFVAPRIEVEG